MHLNASYCTEWNVSHFYLLLIWKRGRTERTKFPFPSLTRWVTISKHQSISESERGEEERTGEPPTSRTTDSQETQVLTRLPHLLTHKDQASRPETGHLPKSIVFYHWFTAYSTNISGCPLCAANTEVSNMAPFEMPISKWERQTRKPVTTVPRAQEVLCSGTRRQLPEGRGGKPSRCGERGVAGSLKHTFTTLNIWAESNVPQKLGKKLAERSHSIEKDMCTNAWVGKRMAHSGTYR